MSAFLSLRVQFGQYTCRSCLARLSKAAKRHSSTVSSQSQLRRPSPVNKSKLPPSPARTRFAPSPTGYLHLGSLRTALFNYLLAKRTGGQFLLRIEDTDKKRTIPDAEKRLFQDLRWAGLEWDEGPEVGGPYGPYKQSERTDIYHEHAEILLKSGRAYRCFCTAHRLSELAEQRSKLGLPTDYDRTCASIPKEESDSRAAQGEKHVVRLLVPDVYPQFVDLVYGNVGRTLKPGRRGDEAYEDPILLKTDGLPTYHLANVVDDHHMKITHVIRGTEWLPATPKHLAMYEAFGWTPPEFAHVGLLTDQEGNKLSKRNFDTDIASFRDKMGVFPEALANFVALLGWSHGSRSDVMAMNDLINKFTMKFTKGNTTVTLGKLWFLQNEHARIRTNDGGKEFDEMVDKVVELVSRNSSLRDYETILEGRSLRNYVAQIIRADAKNYATADDFVSRSHFFFTRLNHPTSVTDAPGIPTLAKDLAEIPEGEWQLDRLKAKIKEITANAQGVANPAKEVYHHLRKVLADGKDGAGVADIMAILGHKESLRRLGVDECHQMC